MPPATAPVMKPPIGCITSEPAQMATKPANAPLCTKPGSLRPITVAARIPPHIAIKELTATRPEMPFRLCALITLNPNQPMQSSHDPIASHGIDDGGGLMGRPLSYRPMRAPSWRTAASAAHPPKACTTIEPAKSLNGAPSVVANSPSWNPKFLFQ